MRLQGGSSAQAEVAPESLGPEQGPGPGRGRGASWWRGSLRRPPACLLPSLPWVTLDV